MASQSAFGPQSELALTSLGKALSQCGQVVEAADTFRRLIVVRPDDAHAHVLLGAALLKMGDVQEAEVHFDKARMAKPGDWMISDLIASARADSGDWETAIRERRESVRHRPYFAPTHNALGFTLLGAGRIDESVGAFREALRLDPRFPPAHVGLASALLERGEFASAQQTIGRGDHGMPPHDQNARPGRRRRQGRANDRAGGAAARFAPRPIAPGRCSRGRRIRAALFLQARVRGRDSALVGSILRSPGSCRGARVGEPVSGRECRCASQLRPEREE